MRACQMSLYMLLIAATFATAGTIQVAAPVPQATTHLWLQSGSDAWLWQTFTAKLPAGNTYLSFPFASADVDPDSLRLELAGPANGVSVAVRTQDPGNARNAVWLVNADADSEARLRLGHYLKGIEWRVDYTVTLRPEAAQCDLQADLTLTNRSKKAFANARVRLPDGTRLDTPLDLGQSTQFTLYKTTNMPFVTSFVYDQPKYGDSVVALFTRERQAGEDRADKAFVAGHVRIFSANPGGAPSLIGEDNIAYGAPGEKLEFRIANVPEVSCAKRRVAGTQVNVKNDVLKKLALFDLDEEFEFAVKNNRRSDITLVLRDNVPGAWEMQKSSRPFAKKAADQIEFSVPLPVGQEVKVGYAVRRKNLQP
jgi:hypothetical protein